MGTLENGTIPGTLIPNTRENRTRFELQQASNGEFGQPLETLDNTQGKRIPRRTSVPNTNANVDKGELL